MLDRMAVVSFGEENALDAGIEQIRRGAGDGVIVAVLGEIDEEKAQQLAHLGHSGKPGIAILIRTEDWSARTTRLANSHATDRKRLIALLRDAGWAVAEASAGQSVTDVWNAATGLTETIHESGFDDDARFQKRAAL
jgi:hypothetical protein